MYTRKVIDKFSERGNNNVISCMCTVCRDVYRVTLARPLHSELLVARMHAEPDASEPALSESPGFVVVVTVRWCTRASSLMELVNVARRSYHACALYAVTYVERMNDVGKEIAFEITSSAHAC